MFATISEFELENDANGPGSPQGLHAAKGPVVLVLH